MFIEKPYKCECCGNEYVHTTKFWRKLSYPVNGSCWHTTCRKCENEKLIEENIKFVNGLKLYKCHICGKWLPAENFNKAGSKLVFRDGLDKRCIECKRAQNLNARKHYSNSKRLTKLLQHRWNGARDRAKAKNIDFTITKEDLENLWKQQKGLCAISKIPMTYDFDSGRVFTNVSIDQINPHLGYTKDNIQLVCMAVNQMKSDMSMDELFMFCEAILKSKYNG